MIKEKKILHILKTQSLLSDGRVLKTIESLKKIGYHSSVVVLEDVNVREKKKENNYDLITFSLFTRSFFKQRKGYFFKVPEFTIKSIWLSIKQDANIWIFQDSHSYLGIFLLPLIRLLVRKKLFVIWDQHELPHPIFLKTSLTRWLYKRMLKNVDDTIFTNEDRRQFVSEHFNWSSSKAYVLNNYPELDYIEQEKTTLPEGLKIWLNGNRYLLWQGFAEEDRNFSTCLKAYTKIKDSYKLVILGVLLEDTVRLMKEVLGDNYQNYVYQSYVPQKEIVKYVDNATFTVIFYRNSNANNWYCEANRLYQPIVRGIPVICGANPPLKRIVEKYDVGIVLEDDGSDSQALFKAFDKLLKNYEYYSDNCKKNRREFIWDDQCKRVYSSILSEV